MNRKRRKELAEIMDDIDELVAALMALKEEEETYVENIPENLKSSVRCLEAENAVDTMDDVLCELESASERIGELVDG